MDFQRPFYNKNIKICQNLCGLFPYSKSKHGTLLITKIKMAICFKSKKNKIINA